MVGERKPTASGRFKFYRLDLHVHWLGRTDDDVDLGYAAVGEHPDGERKSYCAKCVLDDKDARLKR